MDVYIVGQFVLSSTFFCSRAPLVGGVRARHAAPPAAGGDPLAAPGGGSDVCSGRLGAHGASGS